MNVKVIAAIAALALPLFAGAETLSPDITAKIHATTFEVVAAKPDDTLAYEKPLPLELLPFQERTDKYYSIGTAFSIGDNRYVTAGHVLTADLSGSWGPPQLRDTAGHVYSIDKVEKFSLERDFAVFSLVSPPGAAPLDINAEPDLNSVVYTVGNALGTGVVIRDGLFTSTTPEEQEGRWNFMRFSAAASPGNSGGPLLDGNGRIVGVVLRKSANENLNYALPIAEVLKAPDHLAEADNRSTYRVDMVNEGQIGTFKAEVRLPLSFPDLSKAFRAQANAFVDRQHADLLAKQADRLFPAGAGSQRLLHGLGPLRTFPWLLTRNDDGVWVTSAKIGNKTQFAGNGYVEIGGAGHTMMFHWRRPDTVSAKEAYGSPDKLMSDLLATGFLQRNVASEKVKITAIGKPVEDSVYTDRWMRRWQVRTWPLPYANMVFITFDLPVPDGYDVIAQISVDSGRYEHVVDLRMVADFIDAGYDGTLSQWKDFLGQTSLLPALFDGVKIDFTGDRFRYASGRLSFSVPQDVLAVTSDSMFTMGLSWFDDRGKMVWDATDIRLKRTNTDNDWINIQRHIKPSADLGDNFVTQWDRISHQKHPFDMVSHVENDVTKISGVFSSQPADDASPLYTGFVGLTGTKPQEEMKDRLDLLLKDFHVAER